MSNLREYLQNNVQDTREIEDVDEFYKKHEALEKFYGQLPINRTLLMGRGKYNSKICFIFKDEESYKNALPSLQRILPVYGIKIWDLMTLFSDKQLGKNNIYILINEINIIQPKVIYIYDDNELTKQLSNDISSEHNLGIRYINVNNIDKALDANVPSAIFDLFKYLITYNY